MVYIQYRCLDQIKSTSCGAVSLMYIILQSPQALISLNLSVTTTSSITSQVYLHVITYNKAAISFYEANGFRCLRVLPNYYVIDDNRYDSYLYILYVNGAVDPKSVGFLSGLFRYVFLLIDTTSSLYKMYHQLKSFLPFSACPVLLYSTFCRPLVQFARSFVSFFMANSSSRSSSSSLKGSDGMTATAGRAGKKQKSSLKRQQRQQQQEPPPANEKPSVSVSTSVGDSQEEQDMIIKGSEIV